MTSLELLDECERRGYLSKQAAAEVRQVRKRLIKQAMGRSVASLLGKLRKAPTPPPKKAAGFMEKMRTGALTKNEGQSGWSDVTANLAKMLALAGMTAGASAGISGLQRHSKDKALRAEIDTSYKKMFSEYPKLKEMDRGRVQRHFGVLARYAPSMAADPTVAGSWVQSTAQMGQVNTGDIKNLAETQQFIDRGAYRGGDSAGATDFAAKALSSAS